MAKIKEDATGGATSAGGIATAMTRPRIHKAKRKKKKTVESNSPGYDFLFKDSSYKPYSSLAESVTEVEFEVGRKLLEAETNDKWPLVRPDEPWDIDGGNFRMIHVVRKHSKEVEDWWGKEQSDRDMMYAIIGRYYFMDSPGEVESAQNTANEKGYVFVDEDDKTVGVVDESVADTAKAAMSSFWNGSPKSQLRTLIKKYMKDGMGRDVAFQKAKQVVSQRQAALRNESIENLKPIDLLKVAQLDLNEKIEETFNNNKNKNYHHYFTDSGEKHACEVLEINGNLAYVKDLITDKQDWVTVQSLTESVKKKINESYEDRVAQVIDAIKKEFPYGIPGEVNLDQTIEQHARGTVEHSLKNNPSSHAYRQFVKDIKAGLRGYVKRKSSAKPKPPGFVRYVRDANNQGRVAVTVDDINELGRMMEKYASEGFPDSDPTDMLFHFYHAKNWSSDDAQDYLLSRAARQYLGTSSYYSYLHDMYNDYTRDNPGVMGLDPNKNPWPKK